MCARVSEKERERECVCERARERECVCVHSTNGLCFAGKC